ncbi:DUF4126 family protein [Conexibacter sp. SYSU D00693]|uniref:DUF4126 family protein n=1 Tax=Conexibacter sp. SYSU D00693 TaxID=2812560 RepID=UPI00196ABA1B|nr:DUF4126 family protein [Conexibacter sp. SYSU D00693]
MNLILDLLTGLGLAACCGLSPFLPALVAGGLAAGDVGVDFDGTALSFLEEPWFLALMAVLFVAGVVVRVQRPALAAQVGVFGITVGALLFGATLDDSQDTWFYGLVLGALVAAGSYVVARSLFERVRERFSRAGDQSAAAALPVYAEGTGLVGAALSVLLPPVSLLLVGFLAVLGARQRGREGQKYAGLRILR